MKNKITLYLFLFTALILIFQLVNSKKILEDLNGKLSTVKSENEILKDSIFQIQTRLDEVNDFTLEGNNYALRYFDGINIGNIENRVKDQLYETNLLREKNDIIPYAAMDRTFLINKVKVLNHKWVIADFSDGTHWGELLIAYRVNQYGKIDFELKEHFLYPTPD